MSFELSAEVCLLCNRVSIMSYSVTQLISCTLIRLSSTRGSKMAVEFKSGTRFPELDVKGSPREIGRSIGEATKNLIPELIEHTLMRFNQYRRFPISLEKALDLAAKYLPAVETYSSDSFDELQGVAEASGVTASAVMFLNTRAEIGNLNERSGCTSLAIDGRPYEKRMGIVGQNWDNDPELDRFLLVLTRRPNDKPSFITLTTPGIAAYIGLNEAGLALCMNALPGDCSDTGVPWYFSVRGVLESRSIDEVRTAIVAGERARSGNLTLMTPEGAVDFEVHTNVIRELKPDSEGKLVHTNHCLHSDLEHVNDEQREFLYGQTFDRLERANSLFANIQGAISVDDIMQMLSDHAGGPTSICRHPNNDPNIGWQRSVVSVVMVPGLREMFITRGNPCERTYEKYLLN